MKEIRKRYINENELNLENKIKDEKQLNEMNNDMGELRNIKDKLNEEIIKIKTGEENCNNKLLLSKNKANKYSREIEETKLDLQITLIILSIISVALIVCIYMLNSN